MKNEDKITSCPKCEFQWADEYDFIPEHYCSAEAPLDNGEDSFVEPEPVKPQEDNPKSYPEYTSIISQLTESLSCDADEIEDTVNVLNMTEYWVENKMLDVCEDNDVMRKVLWADLQEFIQKYKPQNLSVEELYVTDKSEED